MSKHARATFIMLLAVAGLIVASFTVGVEMGQGSRSQLNSDLDRARADAERFKAESVDLESKHEALRTKAQELEQTLRAPTDKAACPSRSQFATASERSNGEFHVVQAPEGNAAVALQVIVGQEAKNRQVVTMCRDNARQFWYFNRSERNPLLGVVGPASLTQSGFQTSVQFSELVTYELDRIGVTVKTSTGPPETFPIAPSGMLCIDRDAVLDSFRRTPMATNVPECSLEAVRPWTF